MSSAGREHYHIPAQMNETIGRAHDIDAIVDLLRQDTIRLLTLTGPGGVGKTRLAVDCTHTLLKSFPDGTYYIPLAPLHDAHLVLPALAHGLGIEEIAGQTLLEQVQTFLLNKRLLLVFDNFEHVISCATLLGQLLAFANEFKILVTSREVLHLYGEHEYEVLPLTLPTNVSNGDQQEAMHSAAVQLFVTRAQAVKPTFQLTEENRQTVAAICIALDGLPLAIELAAARSKMLTPQTLLARLQHRLHILVGGSRDLPARQQTLRNTLDWSYNLLTETEQYFFRQLGVLTGNWTLVTAEAVAADTQTSLADDALDLLSSLVDKSLVQVAAANTDETRFSLLETLREYALEHLEQQGELAAAQLRHAHYYTTLAEEAESHLTGTQQRSWLRRLDEESANLWLAMHGVVAAQQTELALRLASALTRFLQLQSLSGEGRRWLDGVLNLPTTDQQQALRAHVLYAAGVMAIMQNDLQVAQHHLNECVQTARAVGDRQIYALALSGLAQTDLYQGDYTHAQQRIEAGLAVLDGPENAWHRGMLHSISGQIFDKQCLFAKANVRYRLSLLLLREAGDMRSEAEVLASLGHTMRQRGKLVTAQFLYQKGLHLYQQVDDRWGQVLCQSGSGDIERLQGQYREADKNLAACLKLAMSLGARREQVRILFAIGQNSFDQGDIRQATQAFKECLQTARLHSYQEGIALGLWGLAEVALEDEQYQQAQDYYQRGLALMRTLEQRVNSASLQCGLARLALAKQDYEHAAIEVRQALHMAHELGDTLNLALALDIFASLCAHVAMPERAVQFCATAASVRQGSGAVIARVHQQPYKQFLQSLEKTVGTAAFRENWNVGQNMSLEQTFGMIANISIPTIQPINSSAIRIEDEYHEPYPAGLTPREMDVLRLVAQGLTDASIAQKLVLSPRTVNTHLRSIYAKIGVSSRSSATRYVFEHNLV